MTRQSHDQFAKSLLRADRLPTSPTRFAELAPDLVVEVKSPSDSLTHQSG